MMAPFRRLGLAATTFVLLAVPFLHPTMGCGGGEANPASSAATPKREEDPAAAYRTYIVFMSPPADAAAMSRAELRRWHESLLPDSERLVCSYSAVFNGFSARLTEAELAAVAKLPGFVRALPDRKYYRQTTRARRPSSGSDGTRTGCGATPATAPASWTRASTDGKHVSFLDDGVPEPPIRTSISCGMEELDAVDVNVINVSLGGGPNVTFDQDPIAIGSFRAMAKVIVVVAAAGNEGPDSSTVLNVAPCARACSRWAPARPSSSFRAQQINSEGLLRAAASRGRGDCHDVCAYDVAGKLVDDGPKGLRGPSLFSPGLLKPDLEEATPFDMDGERLIGAAELPNDHGVTPLKDTPVTVLRTLTNVGPTETYTTTVQGPSLMDIMVYPDTLVFSEPGEKQSFNMSVMVSGGDVDAFVESSLIWVSTNHQVRSPVVALVGLPGDGI
ncbi:unnamed protein product [Urochloa decumbens]|uniref:Uncharacterized protein n=1 Tax=Urochloa decumbens TaxID=240449 RepID=A0ABC9BN63_9POAL